jgi:signal transduction histidine kinase
LPGAAGKRWRLGLGLPAKLLLLTLTFVMVAQILIFVPLAANHRRNWLVRRVVAAKIASLALEASGGAALPERLRKELLTTAGVHAVSVKRADFRRLVLGPADEMEIAALYDLRSPGTVELMKDAIAAYFAPPGRLVRLIGSSEMMPPGDEVDVVIDETPLRAELWRYAGRNLWFTLLLSTMTAALVYLTLIMLLVRPMMRITHNMVSYRENPGDASRVMAPSGRTDEIGVAEKELATLQMQLSGLLRGQARLANVGLAVSKISHDLRNMLASAQLVSDRLATVADPTVQHFVPRLMRALDRAITLCSNTMRYGRSEEAAPKRAPFLLRSLIAEVRESLGAEQLRGVTVTVSVPPGLALFADRDQIYRVLLNLMRNALEAIRDDGSGQDAPIIEIAAYCEGDLAIVRVSDNGPGVPANMRENLFKPFQSASKSEGNGLGLVISAELVRAHGGDIALDDTAAGAAFVLRLPAAAQNGVLTTSGVQSAGGKLAQGGFSG